MARLLLSFLAFATGAFAATLTATLKPATVNLDVRQGATAGQ